jgi:hypothetical protein
MKVNDKCQNPEQIITKQLAVAYPTAVASYGLAGEKTKARKIGLSDFR